MNTTQYLDAAKKHLRISSDYALAQRLDLTPQAISKLRRGVAIMSNTTAVKIAEILDVDPMKVIADAELERGSDADLWRRISRKAAAIAIVAIGASSGLPSAEASPSPAAPRVEALSIMSTWRRALIAIGLLPDDGLQLV